MSQHLPAAAVLIPDDDPDFDDDIPTTSASHRSDRGRESNRRAGTVTTCQPHHGEPMSPNSSGPHTCHANGCDTPCTGFMCGPHWKLVPAAMRMAIEQSPDPTATATPIAKAAIAAVAHRESRTKPAASKQVRRHPVQLALFGDDQVLTKGKRT
ncbi:hypothetical protein [Mycobacteroides abscessus]|uniref:hypothetical protein n=1 Tax=Mycobacteroides abscessus TaxID=36809 RepID=UPI0009A84D65|nr:hypothetical protein [Mycobacteroides abscessus]SLJ80585.1 Uncharacterised protein [Mycobacteroides abscessus subsp. abscessus]